ncbi:MAG: aminotransferase class I/II-fold pyridoxal phosphate-dependent enzyme, partial [Chloroflexi bacterium]|nr:aminotransferase class I/II-fold pyridoxal phosphate-dependent enzyme [Chloroflexota bacterium]
MEKLKNRIAQRALTVPPSGIRKFFDIIATMPDVISLGVGEPDFITPDPVRRAGIEALEIGETHYTSNLGLLALREEISRHLEKLYKVHYDPATELIITVGVSEALLSSLLALIDPGDEVIVPEPSFVAYKPGVIFAGGRPLVVETRVEDEFQLLPERLEEAITADTKALLIGYPNNPTGAVMERGL